MPSIEPPTSNVYSAMRETRWSPKEKTIASRVLRPRPALGVGRNDPRGEADGRAIKQVDELWELERHLTQRRKEIDKKYEFKYSMLLLVLGDLVREGRISLDELQGLFRRQMRCIRDHTQRRNAACVLSEIACGC